MKLRIEKESSIKNVQKEFNTLYPYLKIEFFKRPFRLWSKSRLNEEKRNHDEPVSNLGKFNKCAIINVDGKRTAAQVEQDFWEAFGLSIKLFRKSGTLWIETTLTESWTLEKQNEEGEFMSAPVTHKQLFEGEDE
jgi:hypothetical protein